MYKIIMVNHWNLLKYRSSQVCKNTSGIHVLSELHQSNDYSSLNKVHIFFFIKLH